MKINHLDRQIDTSQKTSATSIPLSNVHLLPKNTEPLPGNPERGLACSQGITNCIFGIDGIRDLHNDAMTTLLLIGKGMQAQTYM
ncbi:MAG: hypothetical protein K9J37_14390 [Saprospiraceae bacterium]|nr:hypothetical protein [Saprospiraceae bacterium]MCF8251096.1 hypothetical protein [Saprospiraceae bacterium]MCF8280998.1 hypothetical protein [Bacteroidales bacterium]MCF8312946.1 hypothetical protein [Saprospiraceae bacterium]MCF8441355.1 hypothetical protein [Saprospiraceae bacterium]